jgi:protein involved in polysaccharide export with SLBB domain
MKKTVVSVNGKVHNPGLYHFVEGKNYEYYIQQAGGTIKSANKMKIRIIRAGSGEWINANKNTVIYAGDTIYIPRYERFSYYWPYIKETIAFVSGLATSIVVIKGLIN